ncbi:uncharacterized protein TRIADDRAFT_52395 [Trichoplax adhaerens]|uniref:Uncharacterized protein n=1 Tax=Trichoplax adhaerens TaxID=10228 RepID=B3RI94_TRIAD|nr:hypothetical protein TRIADDRAFT_52395 [Trichoplax adhaerens]EDV28980.1 hypothetical protein TRIADDRAFT_52395 [Trichoplax adhaerens]|eukprot:XP_002108182.1 hypothetical protein TRIADDRAFT_52395 [Trichoplax adhaerens]
MNNGNSSKDTFPYRSVSYGIQWKGVYEHAYKNCDIVGVTRPLTFAAYQFNVLHHIIYAKNFDVYFAVAKDHTIRVLNKDFIEVFQTASELRAVLFLLFNPRTNDLITGGAGGMRIYEYKQRKKKPFEQRESILMSDYKLNVKQFYPDVGGSWVKKMQLNHKMQHVYCMSDTDVFVYDCVDGHKIFKITSAHKAMITGCVHSLVSRLVVTCSKDTYVKVWTDNGNHLATMKGHSKAITNMIQHPNSEMLVLTSSSDGTIKIWSLHIMAQIYSISIMPSGIPWIGIAHNNNIYVASNRQCEMWSLNHLVDFWANTYSPVISISLASFTKKFTHVIALSDDNSIRILSVKKKKRITTILPPPTLSALSRVIDMAYSRYHSLFYVLLNPTEIWIYTTRTDPACRITVWNKEIIESILYDRSISKGRQEKQEVTSLAIVNSFIEINSTTYDSENIDHSLRIDSNDSEGRPNATNLPSFLAIGTKNGRIVFIHPAHKERIYKRLTSRDPVSQINHDVEEKKLIILSIRRDHKIIQFFSLPNLELKHEVHCAITLSKYCLMSPVLLCGHSDGKLRKCHLHSANISKNEMVEVAPSHFNSVLCIDKCISRKVFLTSCKDGIIKVWDINACLISEITLDHTLLSVNFLPKQGDMLLGFKGHLFLIPATKIFQREIEDANQSDHYSDSEVAVTDNFIDSVNTPEQVTMEDYLMPYKLSLENSWFIEKDDQTEGKRALKKISEIPKKVVSAESETDYRVPIEVYESSMEEESDISINFEEISLGKSPMSTPFSSEASGSEELTDMKKSDNFPQWDGTTELNKSPDVIQLEYLLASSQNKKNTKVENGQRPTKRKVVRRSRKDRIKSSETTKNRGKEIKNLKDAKKTDRQNFKVTEAAKVLSAVESNREAKSQSGYRQDDKYYRNNNAQRFDVKDHAKTDTINEKEFNPVIDDVVSDESRGIRENDSVSGSYKTTTSGVQRNYRPRNILQRSNTALDNIRIQEKTNALNGTNSPCSYTGKSNRAIVRTRSELVYKSVSHVNRKEKLRKHQEIKTNQKEKEFSRPEIHIQTGKVQKNHFDDSYRIDHGHSPLAVDAPLTTSSENHFDFIIEDECELLASSTDIEIQDVHQDYNKKIVINQESQNASGIHAPVSLTQMNRSKIKNRRLDKVSSINDNKKSHEIRDKQKPSTVDVNPFNSQVPIHYPPDWYIKYIQRLRQLKEERRDKHVNAAKKRLELETERLKRQRNLIWNKL